MRNGREVEWEISPSSTDSNGVNHYSYERIQCLLLLDIRAELRKLNHVFECHGPARIELRAIVRAIGKIGAERKITPKQAAKALAQRRHRTRKRRPV